MDRSRGPSLVSPAASSNKPTEPPHRLRRKLQKTFPKQRFLSIRRPAPIDPSASNKLNTGVAVAAQQAGTVGHPSLRLSPDLSDAKWHQYLGESNAVQDTPTTPRTPNKPRKVSFDTSGSTLVPEFSHLAVSNATPRPSLDSSLSSPTSSISTRSSMRRRAKTPVYAIGQLESPACGRDSTTTDKVSSVDLIADQYRALLETQDTSSICTDARSDPLPSRQSSHRRASLARSHYSAGETPAELQPDVYNPAPLRNVSAQSPKSDDGTLVAFDEEAIYFKPMSFSPELPSTPSPPPPPPRNRARLQRNSSSQAPANHNLSLQIAADLLTRELSTTMLNRSQQMGTDMSSLQIWVMIEAYERLRDQVMEMGQQNEDVKNMEAMFDTWLRALYNMHDRMTSDAASRGSHYDAAELGTEDLD
ncbi:mating-type switching protein swi10 [Colletotrichum incanum]|uniref:Mating-type switching protein swi10 n=1 Tax=Colletotrichum incanum TaxID=1573173 RepID=A0A161Y6D2_COLIC|nr:mating-type switching protein swi10 [Colletotrichum incanum]